MTKLQAGLTALGTYVPERIMKNAEFESFLDTSDEWIVERTGIKQRHIAADDEFPSYLAIKAVEDLIARHGDNVLEGVDMVILGTAAPDAYFPATAALVQDHFKLKAAAFDLLAGCPGWMYALSVAQAYVESGHAKKILAIGSEVLTKIIDMNDRNTAVLFGDGAGASIVEAVPAPFGFKSMVLGADGSGGKHLHAKANGGLLPDGTPLAEKAYMNGREVFKFAVRVMKNATVEAIEKAGMTVDDVSLFVPHQANVRIIEAARQRLELPPERVVVTAPYYGNNSTATIPLALKHALDDNRINEGDNLLLVSFGAGLTWSSSVLTWGGLH